MLQRIGSIVRSKFIQPVRAACQQQLSTTTLLASCMAATVGGIWPVPLTTFIPCTGLNYLFGGNLLLTQALNLLMTPANLATILPLKNAGEWILGSDAVDISLSEIREHAWSVLKHSPLAIAHAIVGWAVFCVIAAIAFFVVLKPLVWFCSCERRYNQVAGLAPTAANGGVGASAGRDTSSDSDGGMFAVASSSDHMIMANGAAGASSFENEPLRGVAPRERRPSRSSDASDDGLLVLPPPSSPSS